MSIWHALEKIARADHAEARAKALEDELWALNEAMGVSREFGVRLDVETVRGRARQLDHALRIENGVAHILEPPDSFSGEDSWERWVDSQTKRIAGDREKIARQTEHIRHLLAKVDKLQRKIDDRKENLVFSLFLIVLIVTLLVCFAYYPRPAHAHDIYTGVHGLDGQLCCGGNDCAATSFRERGSTYEFLTREGEWVAIPQDRITFLPIPGDPASGDTHRAHLCYRASTPEDRAGGNAGSVFGSILLYCAFIPPGAI